MRGYQKGNSSDLDVDSSQSSHSAARYNQARGNQACQSQLFFEGSVIGHASPKWDHTGGSNSTDLNQRLSDNRASSTENTLEAAFLSLFSEEHDLNFRLHQSGDIEDIQAQGVGDQQTLQEAGGDRKANDSQMRRVDIDLVITRHICDSRIETTTEEYEEVTPASIHPDATTDWAVKLVLGGGAGHAGVGGAFAIGELLNKKTGRKAQGGFAGGGIGVGLSTPGADPGWGDWTDFTTRSRCTFDDFDDTPARLTTMGAGIAIIGYSAAFLSFLTKGPDAQSLYVGGFNMGALGADAGSNVGAWSLNGSYEPTYRPESRSTQTREREEVVPFSYTSTDVLHHTVYFDTGSHQISDAEQERILDFASYAGDVLMTQ